MRARSPAFVVVAAASIASCARTVSPADVPSPRAAPCTEPSAPFSPDSFALTRLAMGDSIFDMSGASSDDLWAVGAANGESRNRGLLAHRDANGWHEFHRAGQTILAVHWIGRDDVWAVTFDEVLHWDGSQWNVVTLPGQFAANQEVWASGARDVWIARTGDLLHFDGSSWAPISFGDGGVGTIAALSVSGTSATDVWIAGYADGANNAAVRHWDGTRWTVQLFPEIRGPIHGWPAWSVTAIAPDDVWVTGLRFEDAMHWDGHTWRWIAGIGWDVIAGACARHDWFAHAVVHYGDGDRLIELDPGTVNTISALTITSDALWLGTTTGEVARRPW